jgi:NTE family protein
LKVQLRNSSLSIQKSTRLKRFSMGGVLLLLCFAQLSLQAQQVGVVLSGGGAGGISHIGVLKALEEHHIPIDYIAGTSAGGLIGGLYASGYSPEEIEHFFLSEKFNLWAYGKTESKYQFYFRQSENDPSWVTFKFSIDTLLENNIPTSYINPFPIDFGLMSLFASTTAKSSGNFDSLLIPFRCVAADITSKKLEVFSQGDIATAVRASMSYPFFLSPVEIDGKLYFDGGIYNNFPADLMCDEFNPDYVIGSNVASNFPKPNADNLLSQIKYMLSQNTNYELDCSDGVVIKPTITASVFDFSKNKEVIDSGYRETISRIDEIKEQVKRRVDPDSLRAKRRAFMQGQPAVTFNEVSIRGVNEQQRKYITKLLKIKKDTIGISRLEPKLISLNTDDNIRGIYPTAKYDEKNNDYRLELDIKKEKKIFLSFGGNLSNKPINEGFIGLKYNYLGRVALNLHGNGHFGQFYSSALGGGRVDFLTPAAFYVKGHFVTNRLNYFESNDIIIDNEDPSFLIIRENYGELGLGVPLGYKGKFEIGGLVGSNKFEYYQDNSFTQFDTTDLTRFRNTSGYGLYERNSLDRKMYPTAGSQLLIKGRYVSGQEVTTPGSTARLKIPVEKSRHWYSLKFRYDKYYNRNGRFKFGTLFEVMYSDQPLFSNYVATILNTPGFEAIPEAKTLFQERYHAQRYGAVGLRLIYSFSEYFDLRVEAFGFQPYREIGQDVNHAPFLMTELEERHYVGSSTAVLHTPIGPLALSLNYYKHHVDDVSVLVHFGYILFNKRMHH